MEAQRSRGTSSKAHCRLLVEQGLELVECTDHQAPCCILGLQDKWDVPLFTQPTPYRAPPCLGWTGQIMQPSAISSPPCVPKGLATRSTELLHTVDCSVLVFKVPRKKAFSPKAFVWLCMVVDVNQTPCGDHFAIYTNIRSLCWIPENNIMSYANYTSIF